MVGGVTTPSVHDCESAGCPPGGEQFPEYVHVRDWVPEDGHVVGDHSVQFQLFVHACPGAFTVRDALPLFPALSVAVKVTVLGKLVQLAVEEMDENGLAALDGEMEQPETVPHESEVNVCPLAALAVPEIEKFVLGLAFVGAEMLTVGAAVVWMFTVASAVTVAPFEPVTVRVTIRVPLEQLLRVALRVACVVPNPIAADCEMVHAETVEGHEMEVTLIPVLPVPIPFNVMVEEGVPE